MMQIEGIIRDTPQPHLEFSAEAELPEGALIVMLKTTLFKQKAAGRWSCLPKPVLCR